MFWRIPASILGSACVCTDLLRDFSPLGTITRDFEGTEIRQTSYAQEQIIGILTELEFTAKRTNRRRQNGITEGTFFGLGRPNTVAGRFRMPTC